MFCSGKRRFGSCSSTDEAYRLVRAPGMNGNDEEEAAESVQESTDQLVMAGSELCRHWCSHDVLLCQAEFGG